MRHGSAGRRHRNRGHGNGNPNQNGNRRGNHNRMQVFDSNGPEVRIRGTAHQVVEKYLALAKDSASMGDRILSESYLQHAEHYQRIINTWEEENPSAARQFYSSQERMGPRQESDGVEPGQLANNRSDLGLPASILGASSKADNSVRTPETAG